MSGTNLWFRKPVLVVTDPQRRVYNGVPFSSRTEWSAWGFLCPFRNVEDAEESAKSYRKLNPDREYKVSVEMPS